MTPVMLLVTSILMGLFVTAGGIWAFLYCLGRARHSRRLTLAGWTSYAVALALVIALVLFTPLGLEWKVLLVVSSLAYAFIPPVTLRYLERQHGAGIRI